MHAIIFLITYNQNTISVGKENNPLNNSERKPRRYLLVQNQQWEHQSNV